MKICAYYAISVVDGAAGWERVVRSCSANAAALRVGCMGS
jgi:hypothetical protein